jgi:MFS family permease
MLKLLRKPTNIQTIYLYLIAGNTLATSFIWGINTIFLLDAGLSNFEAFLANAFYSIGYVIFEVPTGVIADTYGRRVSYLLGALTLAISTALYLYMWQIQGPFWGWAVSSMILGLGYTFFSGATEAWLVDALKATNFKGNLDSVFAKAQMVGGAAMLIGAISGGIIAQVSNLGIPYILRTAVLLVNFAMAFVLMQDLGFKPSRPKNPINEVKKILDKSIEYGYRNPPVRFIMLAAPFAAGVSFYIFYALQPFLLELWGNEEAYAIAGVIAALTGLSQMAGGFLSPRIRKLFKKRTSFMLAGTVLTGLILIHVSLTNNFWIAIGLIFIWGLMFAAITPIRQAYLNGLIPSEQRATVLSFDSLTGSAGAIVAQPALGKVADVNGYPASYAVSSIFQFAALPFIYLARRQKPKSDTIEN